MIIKMLKDAVGSYDGINKKAYKQGEIYKIEHPNERNLFPSFVRAGDAEFYDPARPAKEIKVSLPQSAKVEAPAKPKAKKKTIKDIE
jgi:hypothetical protein